MSLKITRKTKEIKELLNKAILSFTPKAKKIEPTTLQPAAAEPTLIFTDAAADKVKALIEEENNPNLKLRIFITGGGCSGFQYGFTFDEAVNEDDFQIEKNSVTLLVDANSYQYLAGARINYKKDLTGEQFVIENPNASTTCGCGSSFAVD